MEGFLAKKTPESMGSFASKKRLFLQKFLFIFMKTSTLLNLKIICNFSKIYIFVAKTKHIKKFHLLFNFFTKKYTVLQKFFLNEKNHKGYPL